MTDGSAVVPLAYPGAAKTVVSCLNDWGTVVGTWTDGADQEHGFVLRSH